MKYLFLFPLLFLLACAGTRPEAENVKDEFVWPLPPAEAKIRFIRSIHSELDLGKRELSFSQKIFESFFGRPRLMALRKPLNVHVDSKGRVLVADTHWRKVIIFDFKKKKMLILGERGKTMLVNPLGVTTDDHDNIYVADAGGFRIVIYKPDGSLLNAFGGRDTFLRPVGVAVNPKLNILYVVDAWAHQVKAFDTVTYKLLFTLGKDKQKPDTVPEGSLDKVWNRGNAHGEFNFPTNIALDAKGNIYIVDTMNFRVQIFDPRGNFLSTFGQIGNVPGTFARPKGIGLDKQGHIYVSDAAFNNVQIFNSKGQLLLNFGAFGSGKANLRLPAGLYIDKYNKIYIIDQLNHRVQVYQYLGSN